MGQLLGAEAESGRCPEREVKLSFVVRGFLKVAKTEPQQDVPGLLHCPPLT